MPSGKQSKRGRRATPVKTPPPVRAQGARRQASPKVLAVAGGVAAAIAVVVIAVVALTGGKGSSVGNLPTSGSLATALPGAADVHALLKGIPQHGLTLGSPSAPVTMVEYIDLQCPFCDQLETQVMPSVIAQYVRTGKVKIEARLLDFVGPDSTRGRNATIAAGFQNKAFDFAQLLYDNQGTENTGWLSDAMVAQAAKSIPGLNPRKLFAQRDSSAVKAAAARFDADQKQDAVKGTPTLFVGKSGTHGKQVPLQSPTDKASIVSAIQAALAS